MNADQVIDMIVDNECQSDSQIVLGSVLGKGAFGVVRLAKMNSSSMNKMAYDLPEQEMSYAVKCIDKSQFDESDAEIVAKEIDILNACAGISFVAQLHFSFETPSMQYIGLEYCAGGDLYTLLNTQGITRSDAVFYLAEIAIGLSQLHKRQIVFHDLKPENICFDENGHVKLIDFGLATILNKSDYSAESNRREVITSGGTLDYSAPEIFFRAAHSFEADWWSFGVLAYELLCGDLPFYLEDASDVEQCEYICSDAEFHRNDLIVEGSVEESFISMFLVKDQTQRFGYASVNVRKVLNHELFADLDFVEDETM